MTLRTLKTEAMRLAPAKRAELAVELLSSLEGASREEIDRLWLDEANRRYRAYRSGRSRGIPADKAIAAARMGLS